MYRPRVRRRWLSDSYTYYKKILESEDAAEAGIKQISGYHFSSKYPKIVTVRNILMRTCSTFSPQYQAAIFNSLFHSTSILKLTNNPPFSLSERSFRVYASRNPPPLVLQDFLLNFSTLFFPSLNNA